MTDIEKAIKYINELRLADFFALMKSKIGVEASLTTLEQTFIMGKADFDYYERLKTYAQLKLEANDVEKEVKKEATIIQTAEKIYNIENINGDANFL